MKPLSNRQKAVLCQAARRAFDYLVAKGHLADIDLDTWRHDECERAVGKPGLRACDNSNYLRLLSHFESLAGEDGRALNALLRDQTELHRMAEAALVLAMDKAGLGPAYVEKICRDKFKCSVVEASTSALHQLIVTVKSRARAKARKAASTVSTTSTNPCPSAVSIPEPPLNSSPPRSALAEPGQH